ncbi:MAG: aminotransferase class I/II-fold pyridoxal phosphate-dependent enzyme [Salinisphaera sp.]|nr:aminotransferase class I/II-fold pyridoxal phosphate-dependent enzyme [Salinisphaera sp.]
MRLFDKLQPVADIRDSIRAGGVDPLGVPIDKVLSATEAVIRGRSCILAGSNNYLGLSFDPRCRQAAADAALEQGTGTTGSRMANGSYAGHLALERELADFYGVGHAVVFSTGYQANLGMLAALTGSRDTLLLDADCHASIYDGARLSGAQVLRFRHNDAADLDKRLGRLGDVAGDALVVAEGIYSMLGDVAPLAEIATVTSRHRAALLVDEAHSMGVLGATGRGAAEAAGVEQQVDFVVGTFSKSLGAIGGFCVSRHAELDWVRYASRAYIFTASPAPPVIACTRTALTLLRCEPQRRERLWRNARQLYDALTGMGFTLGPQVSPVVAVMFDGPQIALAFWRGLLERGVYVNLMLPPATPNGWCLVRCSLSAAHDGAQLQQIIDAFAELKAALSV